MYEVMMTKGHGSTIAIIMCCSVTTYVVIIFSRITQALDVSDDITTLKEDLKQEMTVSNYVSFKYLPLAPLGLLHHLQQHLFTIDCIGNIK